MTEANQNIETELQNDLIRREAVRIITCAIEAGIPKPYIGVPMAEVLAIVSASVVKEGPGDVAGVKIASFYDINPKWSGAATIEGGSVSLRRKVGCALLYRLMLQRTNERGQTGMIVSMQGLMAHLNSFEKARYRMVSKLSTMPCLFIEEWDTATRPNEKTSSAALLDELLNYRLSTCKATLISFMMGTVSLSNETGYGEAFRQIVVADDSVIRITIDAEKAKRRV